MKLIKSFGSIKQYLYPIIRAYSYCFVCSKQIHCKFNERYVIKSNVKQVIKKFSVLSCLMKDGRNSSNDDQKLIFDDPYTTFTNRLYRHPGIFHNVLVIQPQIRSKTKWETNEECERKLDEAVALVDTLQRWKVVEKVCFIVNY